MNVAIAAIDSSGLTLQHIVIDLASYSQYIPKLRQEIDGVLSGECDGQLHRNSLPKLRKLDSFIKESQRMNPPLFGKLVLGSLQHH
jgi:cytochrome P450